MANKPAVTLTLAGDEKRLIDSFDRGGKAAKDFDGAVGDASRNAEKAGKRLDDVAGSADKAGKSFGGMKDDMDKAGSAMVLKAGAIGLSLVAAFSGVFAQANVGGMLAAQLGGGSERAGELGKMAGQVYGDNFGSSLQDAGEALKHVIGSNLVDEDAVNADIVKVTEKLSTVAQVMQEETGNVSRAVSQMIRTGLVKNAAEGFDLLVRGQQQGLNKSQDLLDTFNEYGTQFRKLGLDGPHAMGLISQAIKAGARDSDVAADALKEFSIRAIDGSKSSQDAFKALGLNGEKMGAQIAKGGSSASAGLDTVLHRLKGVKDPVLQAQIAVGLFGTKAEDLGAALLAMDTTTAVASLGDVAGATDAAMTAIGDTPEAKFEAFKRNMQMKLIDVVSGAMPLLTGLLNFVAKFSDVLLPMGIAIGIVAVAQWAWNAAVAANPIVLVIGLLAGLVIAFITLWNKSAAFRDFFIGAWEDITHAIGRASAFIGDTFKDGLNAAVTVLNWFIHRINWLLDRVNDVSGVIGVPAIPHIPDVPRLHSGGVFRSPSGGEGLALLRDGEHVDAPGQGSGGGELRVTGTGALAELLQAMIADGSLILVGR